MPSKTSRPHIVWFRDDLRLSDHPALAAASQGGAPVICLYVFDEASSALLPPRARPLGGAARWWLAQSLRALRASLEAIGAPLVLRRGPAADIIAALAREADAACVFWNEIAIAPHQAVADDVATALAGLGIASRRFASDLLVDPTCIRTKEGRVHAVLETCAEPRRSCKAVARPQSPRACRRCRQRTARALAAPADPAGLGRRIARGLDARRGVRAHPPLRISRNRRRRLCR
jgi:deoxyribodipyrimidine photolyase